MKGGREAGGKEEGRSCGRASSEPEKEVSCGAWELASQRES